MRMQTFRAASMRDAMDRVKQTLGPEAVILSTREHAGGSVEITAALDPEPKPDIKPAPKSAEEAWFQPDPELLNGVAVELASLRKEIARLRAERAVGHTSTRQFDRLMEELKELVRTMGAGGSGGVDDAIAARLMKGGLEATLARSLVQEAHGDLQAVASSIAQALRPAPPIWERSGRTVAAFVGPTGVGKTTTLAKVAAQAALRQNLDVAIVAADTFRIAGIEQVKVYAELLGVPWTVAAGPVELRQALGRFKDKDLVLVDTTGRSPWRDDTYEHLESLLGGLPIERHLCVPASTSGADMSRIVDRYGAGGVRSLVVTKMDEARAVGGVVHACWNTGFQIAHVTTGQDVPGDIETPDADRLCRTVLG